jgi:acyl dehydratase
VVASALATRDFQDVHHDRDRAVAGGAKDIFLNILTTTGLVQRYLAAWAGPDAGFRAISVRLGVPCHAGDTLTLTGEVTADDGDGDGREISVVGRCSHGGQVRGDHVTATVRLAPAEDR